MSKRGLLTLAVLWTTGCGAAFVYFFSRRDTDDIAGFIPLMFALQLPAFLALVRAPHGESLSIGRCIGIALPGSFVGAFVVFFVVGVLAKHMLPRNDPFNFTPLIVGLFAGLGGLIGTGLGLGFYLARAPHPGRGARAFLAFAIACLVGSVIVVLAVRHDRFAAAVLMGCTVAWSIPLLLACLPRRQPPAPTARVVR